MLSRTEFPGRSIRLIGVVVTRLMDETAPHQLPLWPAGDSL
ncbi:MAG: hypothetical protein ACYCW6_12615 [Candidatus Xenobia bacterium]